jgi:hypothetical protein
MAKTYKLISNQRLTSTTATVTFSSIPATYDDLVIKISARTNVANANDMLSMLVNNNNASIYSRTWLSGDGASLSTANISASQPLNGRYDLDGDTATASAFSQTEIYIPAYLSAANKPLSWTSAMETNSTTAYMNILAGYMATTSAISSIKFTANDSNNSFLSGSTFYLYGIKNS